MLYQGLYVAPGEPELPISTIHLPEVARYVENWGRPHDSGKVAILDDSKLCIGVAWLRLFGGAKPGFGYIDDETPELSIAVYAEYRGRGIGTRLLNLLLHEASRSYRAVSLSVCDGNRAIHLYERAGFEVVRKSGDALVMKKELKSS
jgi:ribosomal protein S18 acetylase RimI-like enzyme